MSDPYGQQPQQPYNPQSQPAPGQQAYQPGPPAPYGQLGEVPLSQPLYGASIGQAFKRFWKKYATFSGRASRSEFWWWFLISYVIAFVLNIVNQAIAGPQPQPPVSGSQEELTAYLSAVFAWAGKASILGGLWGLATLVGMIALSTRRLHDTNRSGWWYLIILIPVVGFIILIVFWASGSNAQGQRYDRATA